MAVADSWFEVSRKGLGRQLAGKSLKYVLSELVQNPWDENASVVTVELYMLEGSSNRARLMVTDDSAGGFANITHAFTMFADSAKKGDIFKRGRFNIGEKLVLALCDWAKIVSEKAAVEFCEDGTRRTIAERTKCGSRFEAVIAMTPRQLAEAVEAACHFLVPEGITTTINGKVIPSRIPFMTVQANLPTIISDAEGVLRQVTRLVVIELHEPLFGEVMSIFEMGLPVQKTGDRWHYNILAKIPQNMARKHISPSYLQKVRAFVFNATAHLFRGAEDASAQWVSDALREKAISLKSEAVGQMIEQRFGQAVIKDPSDPEANNRAVAKGFTVISGGTFNKPQWDNIREAAVIQPAGQKFPTKHPVFSDDPNAPDCTVPFKEWTPGMRYVYALAVKLAASIPVTKAGLPLPALKVRFVKAQGPNAGFLAWYSAANGLSYNTTCISAGKKWYSPARERLPGIVGNWIHELAHHRVSNHLSDDFYKEMQRLGGEVVAVALDNPGLFEATPAILDGTDPIFHAPRTDVGGVAEQLLGVP